MSVENAVALGLIVEKMTKGEKAGVALGGAGTLAGLGSGALALDNRVKAKNANALAQINVKDIDRLDNRITNLRRFAKSSISGLKDKVYGEA